MDLQLIDAVNNSRACSVYDPTSEIFYHQRCGRNEKRENKSQNQEIISGCGIGGYFFQQRCTDVKTDYHRNEPHVEWSLKKTIKFCCEAAFPGKIKNR